MLPSWGLFATSTVALPPPPVEAVVPPLPEEAVAELPLLPPQPAIASTTASRPSGSARLSRAFTRVPFVRGDKWGKRGVCLPLALPPPTTAGGRPRVTANPRRDDSHTRPSAQGCFTRIARV